MGKFYCGKKEKERLQLCSDWRLLAQGNGEGRCLLTRSGKAYVIGWRNTFDFSDWS